MTLTTTTTTKKLTLTDLMDQYNQALSLIPCGQMCSDHLIHATHRVISESYVGYLGNMNPQPQDYRTTIQYWCDQCYDQMIQNSKRNGFDPTPTVPTVPCGCGKG